MATASEDSRSSESAGPGQEDGSKLGDRIARVALVGNPNTGKSTLFNALAGLHVRTGNYAGVTIEKKVGRCTLQSRKIDLVDLPGTYSLAPRSPDELVAVEVLTDDLVNEPPVEVVVCVVNSVQLQRNLFLVSQLLELGKPTIIALNMIDAASARGITIDVERLSKQLGVEVIPTSASKRRGITELKQAIERHLSDSPTGQTAHIHREQTLPKNFYKICDELREGLLQHSCISVSASGESGGQSGNSTRPGMPSLPDDYLIQRMLLDRGGESERRSIRELGGGVLPVLSAARQKVADEIGDPTDMECNARYAWAREKLNGVLGQSGQGSSSATDWLDAVLTNRLAGMFLFAAVMFLIFQSIYVLASWPMDIIDGCSGWVTDLVTSWMAPGILRSLITDGVIAGVGGVLIFLPQIALLFFFLAVLEDCGYMARAAFLVDRVMAMFGLSGKSFLPMMSSFACAVPGVMATRVIENRRDRLATIMVAPLMSCSARLPVYLLLIGAFIPATGVLGGWLSLPALVLMAMYLVGVVTAIPVAWILKKTILRGEVAPFVLELPEYKIPSMRVVFSRVWEASKAFVIRAGTLIFAASILIWFAGYWPGDHSRQYALETQQESLEARLEAATGDDDQDAVEDVAAINAMTTELESVQSELQIVSAGLLEGSSLGRVGHAIEPVVRPLGWDWKIGVGALASFPAREVIIATLGTIYSLGGDPDEEGLAGAMRASTHPDGSPVYSIPVALSVMVFFALCAQCVSTLLVIRRETNSWFWPIFSFTYMTVLAYVGALVTYQVGSRLF
ncbi:Ferrous iron transport protein B [Rubripirellula lacrimiformis]|uniref:Ferrous iron transport protein B n=1 Tax=Rubripirellula lacrimiformis TaxID=1930273 RepID=A0A517NGX9_9BACT|nr:ferrous iron transport protein B [Rubripirellula lacrimiformis]QDT06387.1 Ferrous iron transport protein B [Rubripirellula lacrimiformis]